jgi:hypothetical protein
LKVVHVSKTQPFLTVTPDQLGIESERGRTGGQAEHGTWFLPDQSGEDARAKPAGDGAIGLNDDFHDPHSTPKKSPMARGRASAPNRPNPVP